jgi:hypothetical protein
MAKHRAFVRLMVARFGRDRWNEHVKLVASMLNALAIACLVGALVAPVVNRVAASATVSFLLVLVGLLTHLVAQLVLRYIAAKD